MLELCWSAEAKMPEDVSMDIFYLSIVIHGIYGKEGLSVLWISLLVFVCCHVSAAISMVYIIINYVVFEFVLLSVHKLFN
jgi:hypothetical protein